MNNKKLLIFTAHPDDNIGCCGTCMLLKSKGFDITEVVFTSGENSINLNSKSKVVNKKELAKTRKTELREAAKLIGISTVKFLGLPNDNVNRSLELLNTLIKIIREEKPTIVISENPYDYHYDHRQIGLVVNEAIDKAGWGISKELGTRHKTPLGMYMSGQRLENIRTDLIVDISDFVDKKMQVQMAYGSQVGSSMLQLSEALDKYMGTKIRSKAAEGFMLMNNYPVRVNKLLENLYG